MKKTLSLFGLSILTLVFLMGAVSADINFVSVTDAIQEVGQGDTATVTFSLQETNVSNLTSASFNIPLTLTSGANNLVSASSVTGGFIGTVTQNSTVGPFSLTFSVPNNQSTGTYTGDLNLTGTYNGSSTTFSLPLALTVTSTLTEASICVFDGGLSTNEGDLDVDIKDITVIDGFGKDEEWLLLDEVEVEIRVRTDKYDVDEALVRLQKGVGLGIHLGRTDYGQAFRDFKENWLDKVTNKTTVLILGDARNNYGNPEIGILSLLHKRGKRVIWLNPESPPFWGTDDSEMRRYLPFCSIAKECSSVNHLERVVGFLLRTG